MLVLIDGLEMTSAITTVLLFVHEASHLLQLTHGGTHQMAHRYRLPLFGGEECRRQRDLPDAAAREPELPRQRREVHVGAERHFRRPDRSPDAETILVFGKRKVDDEAHAARECGVHVLPEIRREDRDPRILLHL